MVDKDQIREYLLGTMASKDQSSFEDEYFVDADRFELLEAEENDLVDSYVRGELSAADRRQFESSYLNSRSRQMNLRFAQALSELAADSRPEHAPRPMRSRFLWRTWPQTLLLGSGLAAMLILVVWFGVENLRLRREIERIRSLSSGLEEKQALLQEQIAALQNAGKRPGLDNGSEIAQLERPAAPGQVLRLLPGILRAPGEQAPVVLLHQNNAVIGIRLVLESSSGATTDYAARIYSPDTPGFDVAFGNLKATHNDAETSVLLAIESTSIQPGDYIVSLYASKGTKAKEIIASYSFRAKAQ